MRYAVAEADEVGGQSFTNSDKGGLERSKKTRKAAAEADGRGEKWRGDIYN